MVTKFNLENIKVQSDGIKLGWSIIAVLATFGLGLYITTEIIPLRKDLDSLKSTVDTCQKQLALDHDTVTTHTAAAKARLDHIETDVMTILQKIDQVTGPRHMKSENSK